MAEREIDPQLIEDERLLNELGRSLLDVIQDQIRARGAYNQETKQARDLAKELSRYSREDLVNSKKRERFQRVVARAKAEQVNTEKKIKKILSSVNGDRTKLSKIEADRLDQLEYDLEINQELVDSAENLTKEYKTLDRISKSFDMFGKAIGDIPVIRQVFSEFAKASDVAAKIQRDTGDSREAYLAGAKEFAKGAGKAGIGAFLFQLFSGTKQIEDLSNTLVQTLQIPLTSNAQLKDSFQDLFNALENFDSEDVARGIQNIAAQLGSATVQNLDFIRTFLTLTDRLGLSEEAAGTIFKFAAASGQEFRATAGYMAGMVLSLNDANDLNLRFGEILNDIGNASEATLLTTQKFPGGIAKAAYEARRFGLSLSQLENTSESLLNFQSSIDAELEAELLTGRRLNLERARMASLMGNQAELASEIAKNVGTSEQFAKMNVIQQEALAKAFGMSRQELAKTLIDREALLELEKTSKVEGLAGMKAEERIAALTAKNQEKGMNAAEARAAALTELGEDELARQEKSMKFQDEMSKALDRLQLAIGKLSEAFNVDLMQTLIDSINSVTEFFEDVRNAGGMANYLMFGPKKENTGLGKDFNEDGTLKPPSQVVRERDSIAKAAAEAADKKSYDSIMKAAQDINPDDYDIQKLPDGTTRIKIPTGNESAALLEEMKKLNQNLEGGKLKLVMDSRQVGEVMAINYTAIG